MYFRHHTNHPLPAVPSLPGQPVQLLPPSTTTTTTTPAVALEQQQQQRLQGLLQPDLLGGGGRGRSGRRSRGRELFARALAHLARLVGREQLFGLALQPRQRRLAQQPQRPLQEGAPPHPAPPAPAPQPLCHQPLRLFLQLRRRQLDGQRGRGVFGSAARL